MSELVRVTRGVWRPAEQLDDLRGRVLALLCACPDTTIVAGASAAALHGLWLPGPPAGRVEVIVSPETPIPSRRTGSRRPELRARRQTVAPDEVVDMDGIRVTSEARTWLDLADRLTPPDLVAVGDSALRGSASPADMARVVGRAAHRRGVRRARAVLPLLDSRSRSRPESHLRYALVVAGLPPTGVNTPVYSEAGEWLGEPDLSYEEVRLAIEFNGAEHADPRRMRRDITREHDFETRGGWRMITFGPAQVFGRPDEAVRRVFAVQAERRRRHPVDPWTR